MSQVSWKAGISGGFTTGGNWDTGTVPGPGDDVAISVAGSYTVSLTATVTVGSVTISNGSADLSIANPGGTDTVTGDFTNAGRWDIDFGSAGGSDVTAGGTLTNSGQLYFGNSFLSSPVAITLGGFDNTGGLTLTGSAQGATTLQIGTVAGFGTAGVLTGTVDMNGEALLRFASGQITTIASGAQLQLYGASLLADASDTTHNSALTGLSSIAGYLNVGNGEVLNIAGDISDSGRWDIDFGGAGGSDVTVTGTLTNSGQLYFGNSFLSSPVAITLGGFDNTGGLTLTGNSQGATADTATLQIGTAAGFGTVGVLSGTVDLNGVALLEFASGQITSVASGGQLQLYGASLLADASDTKHNSALTGLASDAGYVNIAFGETVAVTGDLSVTGRFDLDDQTNAGGSLLTATYLAGNTNSTPANAPLYNYGTG